MVLEHDGHRAASGDLIEFGKQNVSEPVDGFPEAGAFDLIDEGETGEDGREWCVEGARVSDGAGWCIELHQFGSTGDRRKRQSASERLADRAEIGSDSKVLLGSSGARLRKRLDLVEEQDQVVLVGEFACGFEESGNRSDAAAVVDDRFDEQCAGFVCVSRDGGFECFEVVVLDRDDQFGHRFRDPGTFAVGRLCVELVGGRVSGDVGEFVVPVEVSEEADNLVATTGGSAESQCVQCGFGSRVGESDLFGTREDAAEFFGEFDMEGGVHAAEDAVVPCGLECLLQARGVVAQQCGSVTHRKVQELASGEVPEPAAVGFLGVDWRVPRFVPPGTRTDSTREHGFTALIELSELF